MTLMPFSHLLPTQKLQMFEEAGLQVPSSVLYGKDVLNRGEFGEAAAAALLVRKREMMDTGSRGLQGLRVHSRPLAVRFVLAQWFDS